MANIKAFSIIEALTNGNINFFRESEFNFSSANKSQIKTSCVCFLKNSKNEHVQVLYTTNELLLESHVKSAMNDDSFKLNKDYLPREILPFGNFLFLQPFSSEFEIKTLISGDISSSTYLRVKDLTVDEFIVVRTDELLNLFEPKIVDLREKSNSADTGKIVLSKSLDDISKASEDHFAGSLCIKDSHIMTQEINSLTLDKDLIIPFFLSTSEEILNVNGEGSYVDPKYIMSLFNIDHLVETAYLIQAHKVYPELENYSIGMEDIISYVGSKESFEWLSKMAGKASEHSENGYNKEFLELYFKFASYINVASEVCSKIVSSIIKNEPSLKRKGLDESKMIMVSRLINFPSVLLATNSRKEDYNTIIEHITINPTHNTVEICDAILGYNEIDLVSAMLKNDSHIPQYIQNTLIEQYNPMYNGDNHLYPNLNYIASTLMANKGVMQTSVFAPSRKMAYALAKKIGISDKTMEITESRIEEFKREAINSNRIHAQKKAVNQKEIKDLLSKFTIPFFKSRN